MERLRYYEQPIVSLILTYADQATRRAVRSFGHPNHRHTFVAAEGEVLAADAEDADPNYGPLHRAVSALPMALSVAATIWVNT